MCGCFRGNSHTDSTEVGPSVHSNQRVSNPSHHFGESDECLCVLPVSEEAVALQDGRLYKAGKVREKQNVYGCVGGEDVCVWCVCVVCVCLGGGRMCVCGCVGGKDVCVDVFGGGGGG